MILMLIAHQIALIRCIKELGAARRFLHHLRPQLHLALLTLQPLHRIHHSLHLIVKHGRLTEGRLVIILASELLSWHLLGLGRLKEVLFAWHVLE